MHESAFEPFVRNAWYVAAWSEELNEDLIARTIMNEPVVLFRDAAGRVAALEDRCCHRGTPLSKGQILNGCVQCGYHGLEFDGTGACVNVPGQDNIPFAASVIAYPVVERQHFIWIWMGDPIAADESKLIDYPYFAETDRWPSKKGRLEIAANYVMMVDNLMDLTHLAFVHKNTIGGDPDAHINRELTVTPTENGVKFERWMMNCPPPPTFLKAFGFKGRIDRWGQFEYVPPASVLQWTGALDAGMGVRENRDQPGLHIRIFHTATPLTESSFHYFFAIATHRQPDQPEVIEELFDENYITFLEDKAIMEVQQRRLEADPHRPLVAVRGDAALESARQALHRLIDAERDGQPAASHAAE